VNLLGSTPGGIEGEVEGPERDALGDLLRLAGRDLQRDQAGVGAELDALLAPAAWPRRWHQRSRSSRLPMFAVGLADGQHLQARKQEREDAARVRRAVGRCHPSAP